MEKSEIQSALVSLVQEMGCIHGFEHEPVQSSFVERRSSWSTRLALVATMRIWILYGVEDENGVVDPDMTPLQRELVLDWLVRLNQIEMSLHASRPTFLGRLLGL